MPSGDTPEEAPVSFRPLPGRPENRRQAFYAELAQLVAATLTPLDGRPVSPEAERDRTWENTQRARLRDFWASSPVVTEELFGRLIETGIYDPDPSFNRQFIDPAITHFGLLPVMRTLLSRLTEGPDWQRAGAARAWYWARCAVTEESANATAELRSRWRQQGLHEFIRTDDDDVRCCILGQLPLTTDYYPADLWPLVTQAIAIARASANDYLRHRVELQVRP